MIDLIANTTTTTGPKVYARLDRNTYATKIKVTDAEIAAVDLTGDALLPSGTTTSPRRSRQ